MKEELSEEKKVLEVERDEEKVDLVMKYHSEDEDCLLAGKPLKYFDLKISTVIPFDTLGIRFVQSFMQFFITEKFLFTLDVHLSYFRKYILCSLQFKVHA